MSAVLEERPNVDKLSFTSRDAEGRICWWDVTPPKTDYWHVHELLGRAYAFEVLDLIKAPDAEYPEHMLAYIAEAMARWSPSSLPWAPEPMRHGFFGAISEYLTKGTVDR